MVNSVIIILKQKCNQTYLEGVHRRRRRDDGNFQRIPRSALDCEMPLSKPLPKNQHSAAKTALFIPAEAPQGSTAYARDHSRPWIEVRSDQSVGAGRHGCVLFIRFGLRAERQRRVISFCGAKHVREERLLRSARNDNDHALCQCEGATRGSNSGFFQCALRLVLGPVRG
jgi:hypothetical protein